VRGSFVGAGLDGMQHRDHVVPAVAETDYFAVELTGEVEQRVVGDVNRPCKRRPMRNPTVKTGQKDRPRE
jgi:hypothetical protein